MANTNGTNKNNVYGWYIAILSAFIGCMLSAGFPQFSMAVSYLSDKMQVSQEVLLIGDTVKTIAVVISMMISGFCFKALGAKKTITLGMLLTVVPQSIFPYNDSVVIFFLLKFIQGFTSIIFPVFLLMIMDWVKDTQTGIATAAFNGIFYGGGGIGATFAGFVINKWGWVASFHAITITTTAVCLLWIFTVKERKHSASEIAKEEVVVVKLHDQSKDKKSVSIADLLKIPAVYCLILAFIPTTFAVQAISVDLPLYGNFLGYGEIQNGSLGVAVTIGMITACLISGKCSDYFASKSKNKAIGRIGVLMAGSIIIVASILVLLISSSGSFGVLYAAVLFFSFGASWGLGVFYSVLPDIFNEDTLTISTGFIGGFGDMMMPIAPFIVGVMFGVKGLWTIGWGVCAALALIGVLACLTLIKILSKNKGESIA
ncbi:MFS transporter [Clostridioides mangenotii]|uniref:MFS transporter n=1 Tax=Metaclostridioides mangenotii TaxID=1540 RepID=UPI00214A55D6|nr:MFS transporter [Clostridioides mangenotii]MCR1955302.1 MFS transporter [Clostridioides mangenotii]